MGRAVNLHVVILSMCIYSGQLAGLAILTYTGNDDSVKESQGYKITQLGGVHRVVAPEVIGVGGGIWWGHL